MSSSRGSEVGSHRTSPPQIPNDTADHHSDLSLPRLFGILNRLSFCLAARCARWPTSSDHAVPDGIAHTLPVRPQRPRGNAALVDNLLYPGAQVPGHGAPEVA